MRLLEILREAHRNTATGMSRAIIWLLCWTVAVAAPVLLDTATVASVLAAQEDFRNAGGDVTIVSAPGHVTADGCLGLNTVDGIEGAIALRKTTTKAPLAALPNTAPPLIEYAGDLAHVLPVSLSGSGIALDASIAKELGAEAGSSLAGTDGASTIQVAGVFDWPDDGRVATLSGAALAPVPATGSFDECWVRAWPPDTDLQPILLLATDGDSSSETRTGPLNDSLGVGHSTAELLTKRTTAMSPWTAPLLALIIGILTIWLRRIEFAGNLHAGAQRAELTLQVLLETASWVLPAYGLVIVGEYLLVQQIVAPGDALAVFLDSLAPISAAAAATLIGSAISIAAIRRSSLYRYVKDR
ncbi:MAG: hypothetical protein LBE60_11135 [Microbacterium sp.]|jgi:hypothetical protein|uniref:hypothetical protein n=1 Tax=Microbacterium sp. TaxID=51671 RepID=UPI00282F35C3|nr:hypothetical protein [Microbacterium sp.]MDR2322187.1 hypothetical protein [Microbacterium sp.]